MPDATPRGVYAALMDDAAEIARLLEKFAVRYPHSRLTVEIGDKKIVRVEIAPRFVETELRIVPVTA